MNLSDISVGINVDMKDLSMVEEDIKNKLAEYESATDKESPAEEESLIVQYSPGASKVEDRQGETKGSPRQTREILDDIKRKQLSLQKAIEEEEFEQTWPEYVKVVRQIYTINPKGSRDEDPFNEMKFCVELQCLFTAISLQKRMNTFDEMHRSRVSYIQDTEYLYPKPEFKQSTKVDKRKQQKKIRDWETIKINREEKLEDFMTQSARDFEATWDLEKTMHRLNVMLKSIQDLDNFIDNKTTIQNIQTSSEKMFDVDAIYEKQMRAYTNAYSDEEESNYFRTNQTATLRRLETSIGKGQKTLTGLKQLIKWTKEFDKMFVEMVEYVRAFDEFIPFFGSSVWKYAREYINKHQMGEEIEDKDMTTNTDLNDLIIKFLNKLNDIYKKSAFDITSEPPPSVKRLYDTLTIEWLNMYTYMLLVKFKPSHRNTYDKSVLKNTKTKKKIEDRINKQEDKLEKQKVDQVKLKSDIEAWKTIEDGANVDEYESQWRVGKQNVDRSCSKVCDLLLDLARKLKRDERLQAYHDLASDEQNPVGGALHEQTAPPKVDLIKGTFKHQDRRDIAINVHERKRRENYKQRELSRVETYIEVRKIQALMRGVRIRNRKARGENLSGFPKVRERYLKQWNDELRTLEARQKTLLEEKERIISGITELRDQVNKEKKSMNPDKLSARMRDAHARKVVLEQKIKGVEDEISFFKSSKKNKETSLKETKNTRMIPELKRQIANAQNKLIKKEARLKRLQTEMTAIGEEIKRFEAEKTRIATEIQKLQTCLGILNGKKFKEKSSDQLVNKCILAQTKYNDIEGRIAANAKRIIKLNANKANVDEIVNQELAEPVMDDITLNRALQAADDDWILELNGLQNTDVETIEKIKNKITERIRKLNKQWLTNNAQINYAMIERLSNGLDVLDAADDAREEYKIKLSQKRSILLRMNNHMGKQRRVYNQRMEKKVNDLEKEVGRLANELQGVLRENDVEKIDALRDELKEKQKEVKDEWEIIEENQQKIRKEFQKSTNPISKKINELREYKYTLIQDEEKNQDYVEGIDVLIREANARLSKNGLDRLPESESTSENVQYGESKTSQLSSDPFLRQIQLDRRSTRLKSVMGSRANELLFTI